MRLSQQVAQLENENELLRIQASRARNAEYWQEENWRLLNALVDARMEIIRRDNPAIYDMLNVVIQ